VLGDKRKRHAMAVGTVHPRENGVFCGLQILLTRRGKERDRRNLKTNDTIKERVI